MGVVVYMARVTRAITGPKTGSGCRATPFKSPSLWIQPPKTNTVQGHIKYSPHWWVFVQEFPIQNDF